MLGCRKLADIYNIRKTAAGNILKYEKKKKKKILNNMKCSVKNSKKRNCHGKYHKINEILLNGTRDFVLLRSTGMV